MRIIATDFHTLLSPAQCERRVYLDARATETQHAQLFQLLGHDRGEITLSLMPGALDARLQAPIGPHLASTGHHVSCRTQKGL